MKEYWKDIENKTGSSNKTPQLPDKKGNGSLLNMFEEISPEGNASRRDFLKLCGFSFAVSALASCETGIRKSVPYLVSPIEITPGEANYYASTYMDGSDYCSIVVKTREGRPIKIEGNTESGITAGGTGARIQASVLDLYDSYRFKNPLKNNKAISWDNLDTEVISELNEISKKEGKIVILSSSVYSPSTEAVLKKFTEKYPSTEVVYYDAISSSAILEANMIAFDMKVIPDYRFDKAELIVSFSADFLGTWLSPVEYSKQYSSKRKPEGEMSQLIHFESGMSLTGSNADKRIQIKPSQEAAILLNIYNELNKDSGQELFEAPESSVDISGIARKLIKAKGKSLVVSNSNDKSIQLLVNAINITLDNIGNTILLNSHLRTKQGIDSQMDNLVKRMNDGEIAAILLNNVNPVYSYHNSEKFISGLKKTELTISFASSPDETSEYANYICPDNHYLESWNDAEAKKGKYSLMQPVIQAIYNTRQMQNSLLKWIEAEDDFYTNMNKLWTDNLMPLQTTYSDGILFFDNTVQKGVFEPASNEASPLAVLPDFDAILKESLNLIRNSKTNGKIEVIATESIALGNGKQANNPWLQELPDPISKVCWDNYASISPKQAKEMDLSNGDLLQIGELEIPAFIQPGQAYKTISVALGYGKEVCGPVGKNIGVNAYRLLTQNMSNFQNYLSVNEINKTGKNQLLVQTQTHHSMEGRSFVREANVEEFKKDPVSGNEKHHEFNEHAKSLYKKHEYKSHHWGMAIDLSTCTGCSNCVVACQAENNIPVVGKDEVHRVHEMHWLRIDRYYSGDENEPEVVFQPVMCQHCDNAPCENVCPVAATNHSEEGLNQMIYNRCIGTRYCNNNCPYKVRRFNWFNYTEAGTLKGNLHDSAGMTNDTRKLVLNPDVTVRSQGVIEKCSFCIQRIHKTKLDAKAEKRKINDDELQTACSQSCPSNSIVFGDMNDPGSEISKLISSERKYNLLEEIYTQPSVHYLTKIRNKKI